MRVKEYLQQIFKLERHINQRQSQLEELIEYSGYIKSIDYANDRVQSSKSSDADFVSTIHKITDLQAEINAKIDALVDIKNTIIQQIQTLDNTIYADILYKRYVECKKLEQIAVEMNYSYDWVRHKHGKALKYFEKQKKTTHKNTCQGVIMVSCRNDNVT